jgi:hypothetical protein
MFDYAGLFPPAGHAMEDALTEFLHHHGGIEGFLVNQFVCPAGWVNELAESIARVGDENIAFDVTLIGTSVDRIEADVASAEANLQAFPGVLVTGYELKINPTDFHASHAKRLAGLDIDAVFVELPVNDAGLAAYEKVAVAESIGVKMRTGGLEEKAYPTPSVLANAIKEAVDLNLSIKMTAGLHHPLYHRHATLDTHEFGFLNVGLAVLLANTEDLSAREIEGVLTLDSLDDVQFLENEIRVGDHMVMGEDLKDIRDVFYGIGSCSITEPINDLDSLGLY